jgi:hypothetical protein
VIKAGWETHVTSKSVQVTTALSAEKLVAHVPIALVHVKLGMRVTNVNWKFAPTKIIAMTRERPLAINRIANATASKALMARAVRRSYVMLLWIAVDVAM